MSSVPGEQATASGVGSRAILVGRAAELTQLERFLDRVGAVADPARVSSMLLTGEMGIGKTALLRRCAELAATRGYHLMSASPAEVEMPLEFASLADLLIGVPAQLIRTLPDPQRRAIETAVLRESDPADAIDARTIATAFSAVVRALAATAPVVLAIDDVGWLDVPSVLVISFLMRRAAGMPVGLVAALRTDLRGTVPPTFVDALDPATVERVRVAALHRSATAKLLAARRGAAVSAPEVARIQRLSGGNPLFALGLNTATGAQDAALPVSLRRLADDHLGSLSEQERAVLLLAALTVEPTAPVLLGASADPVAGQRALHSVMRDGVLVEAGEQLSFAHPLLRSVIADSADPATRRAAHRRLAEVEHRPEIRARHVALAAWGPDQVAAAAAEDAARIAAARGATDTAAELAVHAMRLTPATARSDTVRRTALLADYRFQAADVVGAEKLLAGLTSQIGPGPQRAAVLMRLARCRAYLGQPLVGWTATLSEALAEAAGDDALSAAILRDLAIAANNAGDNEAAVRHTNQALDLAGRCGDSVMQAQLWARLALVHFFAGAGVRHDLIDRAIAVGPSPAEVSIELRPTIMIGHVLHLSGDLDRARELYEREYARAKEDGVEAGLPILLFGLVETEVYAGNLDRAEQWAERGFALLEDESPSPSRLFITAARALVHAYRGRVEATAADLRTVEVLSAAQGVADLPPLAAHAIGVAGLPTGDYAQVHEQLAALSQPGGSAVAEPAMAPYLPDHVEALIRLGRLTEAAELLDPYEQRAREVGRGRALAAAVRCRALLRAARRDLSGSTASADEALALSDRLGGLPLERARTLLVAGEVHRRARHRARAATYFAQATALFERSGAPAWAAWAARSCPAPSRAAAAATPADDSGPVLTGAEQKVAELAADGRTNAAIAAELFMAQRTVEAHLSRVYRKLGVRSRTEMSSRLRRS